MHPKAVPQWVQQWFDYRGMDLSKDYIEINVVHHCFNGGFRINENGQTTIPGLYAVKKTAGKMQLSTLKLDEEWKDKPDDLGETRWG